MLLVANSRGINIWCSTAGGHFTNHSVISVVKTSGIEDLVDHRKLVLPQLGATGLNHKELKMNILFDKGTILIDETPENLITKIAQQIASLAARAVPPWQAELPHGLGC